MTFLPRAVNKPFAFHMVISPTDSYMLAVQMRFIMHITSALKTHIIKKMRCHAMLHYVTLCHVMSPYIMSDHKAAVSW